MSAYVYLLMWSQRTSCLSPSLGVTEVWHLLCSESWWISSPSASLCVTEARRLLHSETLSKPALPFPLSMLLKPGVSCITARHNLFETTQAGLVPRSEWGRPIGACGDVVTMTVCDMTSPLSRPHRPWSITIHMYVPYRQNSVFNELIWASLIFDSPNNPYTVFFFCFFYPMLACTNGVK